MNQAIRGLQSAELTRTRSSEGRVLERNAEKDPMQLPILQALLTSPPAQSFHMDDEAALEALVDRSNWSAARSQPRVAAWSDRHSDLLDVLVGGPRPLASPRP